MVDMVNQVPLDAFEAFVGSLFRFTRTVRTTSHLWVQLPGNLKRGDIAILRELKEHGDLRPGCIAESLGVGPSVISRQLTALVEEGVIVRRPDPDDGRAELIRLTASGAERLAMIGRAYVAGMRAQFADWDNDRVREATALLDEIADHIVPALGHSKLTAATTTSTSTES